MSSYENTGSCQCRAIQYKISEKPFDCCFCHCSICRRLTGSAAGSYGTLSSYNFHWLKGESLLSSYKQNERLIRQFCSQCGSPIVSHHSLAPDQCFISLGSLDSDHGVSIEYQQFVASKANWSSVNEGIRQHQEWPQWVYDKVENINKTTTGKKYE